MEKYSIFLEREAKHSHLEIEKVSYTQSTAHRAIEYS